MANCEYGFDFAHHTLA